MDKVYNNDNMRRYLHMAASRSLGNTGNGGGSEDFDVVEFGNSVARFYIDNDPESNIDYDDIVWPDFYACDNDETIMVPSNPVEFAACTPGIIALYRDSTINASKRYICGLFPELGAALTPNEVTVDGETYYVFGIFQNPEQPLPIH